MIENNTAEVIDVDCAPIHVSLYRSARDPEPVRQDDFDSWGDLVASLQDLIAKLPDCSPDRTPKVQKTHLRAFGPYRLSAPYRSAGNVEALTLLAIDIDRCDLGATLNRIHELGIASLVYGSPSDDATGPIDARRVRVLAPVSREITPDECERTRYAFAELLGITPAHGIEGAKDPSRIFFIGRLHGAPAREWIESTGVAVDVDDLLAQPLTHAWEASPRKATDQGATSAAAPRTTDTNDARVVALLADEYASGERHELVRALGGYLARRGWDDARIRAVVEDLPSDQVPARVVQALDAATRARTRQDAPGWDVLCRRLGEATAQALRALAKDPREPDGWVEGAWSEWWARAYAPGGWADRHITRQASNDVDDVVADPDRNAFHPPVDEPESEPTELRSDLGNARRLVRIHGARLRYFRAYRTWYVWTGARWEADTTGEVERCAKSAAEQLWIDAQDEDDADRRKAAMQWAVKSQDRARIANMIELASSEPGIPVTATMLDSDPWLLNVQNGTLDLRTGDMREPDPALLMTKCCATTYDPDATSELWDAFIARTTGGDAELAAYIQRALGYALLGEWHEKHFWFAYGPPDGAKSTLLGVVGAVLGDYHVSAAAKTWMVQSNLGGNRGDLTRLLGARLVTSLEIAPGMRFDEELVKNVTGGDRIVAAAKYKDEVEFPPTFALWMGANDRPTIRDDDDGMWSRMQCVPFVNVVPKDEQDRALRQKLTSNAHAPAVLRWLVDGVKAWHRDGLGTCAAVTTATSEYRRSMNQAVDFLEERVEVTGDTRDEVPYKVMRSAYERWCDANNIRRPLAPKGFGARLRALGVQGGDDGSRHAVTTQAGPGQFTGKAAVDRHWFGVKLV